MANYTVTKFQTTESVGDSIFFNNMVTSGTVTITPKSRYVVSASDFSISSLPTGIESVVFTDSTTAGQPGNTVVATFTFSSDFSLTSNINVGLNIQGDAKVYNPETQTVSYVVKLIDQQSDNLNGASAVSPSGALVQATGSVTDPVRTYTITGSITKNTLTKIAFLTITNDPGGYYFKTKTYLTYINLLPSQLILKQTGVTRDSSNRITAINYDVLLKLSASITSAGIAKINYDAITIPEVKKEIISVDFGSNEVSNLGGNKRIRVYGNAGAEFDLVVIKNSDKSSIITGNKSIEVSSGDYTNIIDVLDVTAGGTVRGINKKINNRLQKGITFCEINQAFPAGTDTYSINIYPRNGTTLGSKISTTFPNYTISQFANPTLTFNAQVGTGTGYTVAATRVDYVGRPNKKISELKALTSLPAQNSSYIRAQFDFTYVATRSSSNTFKSVTNPVWSSINAATSHWSNSVRTTNGGTHVEMFNLKTVYSDGDTKATITGTIRILKYGNASAEMVLDTGKFLTCN
tara:strand:+ start:168 stop:1727 length:1560 start_codon:yes stop_codon:yes gene_type:complete